MMVKSLCVIVLCAGLSACNSLGAAEGDTPVDETFLEVARNPDKFAGQVVTLRAWISVRHEDNNLWATLKDHENWETRRCISLVNYSSLEGMEAAMDGHFVQITGTVIDDASKSGTVLRLGSCRDVALEIAGPSSIKLIAPQ
ncbi:hypothetical protein [Pseudoxanthomonas sp. X-1]|uniref:hypothetical protein n=1 Tax=Pseudoxanthomonas sp. X-1 TaxID=2571115 RepID=UPI00110B0B65|nr:hypothetical protein [Pseudoxanthomonas sp. X-1]TMN16529.1 hypothetical protein FF950_18435 [Pseudoxanthomonas sp. X-1]UAY75725.1 hypothetical protein LAJ50_05625 [Pseudoxanthomonas sp. X-1]